MAILSEATKYHGYARECVRLAGQAKTPEQRDRLIDLARIWMDAALTEEEAEEKTGRPSFFSPPPVHR